MQNLFDVQIEIDYLVPEMLIANGVHYCMIEETKNMYNMLDTKAQGWQTCESVRLGPLWSSWLPWGEGGTDNSPKYGQTLVTCVG